MMESLSDRIIPSPPDGVPVVELDPYSDKVLREPEIHADIWLDAGSAFWIAPVGVWGIARHAEALNALRNWKIFSSRGGNGIIDKTEEREWRYPSALLETDPPEHTQNRELMNGVLNATTLQPRFEDWAQEADSLVERLVARRSFDAAIDLAREYGHAIVPREIGIKEHRPDLMSTYMLAAGNSQYPYNEPYKAANADPLLPEAIRWVGENCERDRLDSGGWGAAVYAMADEGRCPRDLSRMFVRSLISAGVENTVLAIGNMLYAFAVNPEQWDILLSEPALARNAVEEVMRWYGPSHQFYRTTTDEARVGEVVIPAKSKVLIMLGIANRDPTRWEDPERFDITRKTAGQLGFGFGPHQCLGQMVARQEMLVMLEALIRRVRRLEFEGEPVRLLHNTGRGFTSIPIRVEPV